MKRIVFAALAVFVIGVFAYRFHQSGQQTVVQSIHDVQVREGIPVEVETVSRSDVEVWRTFSGTVEGITQTSVVSDMAEEATEILRNVGDRVRAGETLIRLSRRKALPGVGVRYRQNLAAYENLKKEVERLEALYRAGAVAEQQLDAVRTQQEIARADLDAAVARLDLTCPIDGIVLRRNVEPGDIVQPGAPLMVIADLSQVNVRLRVSGTDARRLRTGQRARIAGGADTAQVGGEVQRISLSADPSNRLVEVELRFDNASGGLMPGTLVTTEVLLECAGDVPVVSKRGLVQEAEETYVWVVDDGTTARRRLVNVGLTNARQVEVRAGLEVGERVVVAGGSRLEPGRKVKVIAAGGDWEEG